MRVGLHIGRFHWPGSPENIGAKLADIARTADEAGFYSLWVMDHLFQLGEKYGAVHGPVDAPMLEGYSTVAYLAGITQRIHLGVAVTCTFFREPGLLIKLASTLDVLSGGRTYFGIGAGWFEREAVGLGLPFPSVRERFERLEETLRIAHQMWAGDVTPFEGQYYRLAEPLNSPQPLSRPHPPILIGGEGEKKTLRLVAKYADACNFVIGSPLPNEEEFGVLRARFTNRQEMTSALHAFVGRKFDALKQHCQEIGRPFDDIERTVITYVKLAPGSMASAEIVDICHLLADVGFQHVIFNMPNVHEITPLEVMGKEIIPQVATLASATPSGTVRR